MANDANIANDAVKTNPGGATGPRTSEGKEKSSRNALQFGLYTTHDFIREGEEREYAKTYASLMLELSPEGTLEQTFSTEIMGCTWRLRRCRMVEFDLATQVDTDPMMTDDARIEKILKSVDRARAQSHNILRRSISELRTLQTERTIRLHLQVQEDIPGVSNTKQLLQALKLDNSQNNAQNAAPPQKKEDGIAALETLMAAADAQLAQQYRDSGMSSFCNEGPAASAAANSFCKPAKSDLIRSESRAQTTTSGQNVPRNAQCPCGSGKKYKRCCGFTTEASILSAQNPGNGTKPVVEKAA
jgi:hypothetical protein